MTITQRNGDLTVVTISPEDEHELDSLKDKLLKPI